MQSTSAPEWTVGDRIRKARLDLGLTQFDLAAAVPIHFKTLARWERGTTSPSADDLVSLARALDVPAGWLLGDAS